VAEEISKYKLDLVGVQEVRWGGGGTETAGEYTFFYGKGNENHDFHQSDEKYILKYGGKKIVLVIDITVNETCFVIYEHNDQVSWH
jgi:hypothetical protein